MKKNSMQTDIIVTNFFERKGCLSRSQSSKNRIESARSTAKGIANYASAKEESNVSCLPEEHNSVFFVGKFLLCSFLYYLELANRRSACLKEACR